MAESLKGPEKYISLPIKIFGLDPYSGAGILPVIFFPFSIYAWGLAFSMLVFVLIASRYRLPPYQLIRYFRTRLGPQTMTPYRQQQYREKQSVRPWPY